MSRFIVYSEAEGAAGKPARQVFVNLDHIAKAMFDPDDGKLTVFFTADFSTGNNRQNSAVLQGQEARDALKVLREVV